MGRQVDAESFGGGRFRQDRVPVDAARYGFVMSSMEFWSTTVPGWITALAAVAAVVAAVWAGRTAKGLYDREAARDQRVIENAERAQADLVAAWVAFSNEPLIKQKGFDMIKKGWVVRLRNASNAPVYDVDVRVDAPGGQHRAGLERMLTLPPTSAYEEFPMPDISHALTPTDENYGTLRAGLSFTDASGRRWIRSSNGTLKRLYG